MNKTTSFLSGMIAASFLASVSFADLQPMDNSELSQVSAQDGIGLRLEVGLSTNPDYDDFVPMNNAAVDPGDEWEDSHLRARSLAVCDDSAGVNRDCARRIAIEFPKDSADGVGQDAPFAVLLDGFELAVTFEQINLDIEEITRDGNAVGALKVSFPKRVDISRLTIDKVSLVPTNGNNSVDFDATPTPALGDAADNSLFGYTNNQINLFGLDVDATFQIDGNLYLFPVDLRDIDYGLQPAVASSALVDANPDDAVIPNCSTSPSLCSLQPTFANSNGDLGFIR